MFGVRIVSRRDVVALCREAEGQSQKGNVYKYLNKVNFGREWWGVMEKLTTFVIDITND